MAFRRHNLTKRGIAKHLQRLEQLRKSGVDVQIPPEWRENSRILDIVVAPPLVSQVWNLPTGTVCYAVWTSLLASQSGLTLLGCKISTRWDDQIVLASFDQQKQEVDFGRHFFRQREMLNQRIENYLRLDPGQLIEGWLLATGLRPIPPEYRSGAIVPFELTFCDQFDREFKVEAGLSVLRTAKRAGAAMQPGSRLFDAAENQKVPELPVSENSGDLHPISEEEIASRDVEPS